MTKRPATFIVLCCALIIVALPVSYVANEAISRKPVSLGAPDTVSHSKVILAATGDIMGHMPLVNAAKDSTGHYNFLPFFEYCISCFAKADIVTGNLETTLSDHAASYSGYPTFCTPKELAVGLKNAGFMLLTTANNHSYDKGEKGVVSTLDWLDSAGLLHTGTSRCSTEAVSPVIIEKNNLKIAFIAYTTLLNGFVLPVGKPYLVNLYSAEKLKSDVKTARTAGADFIVCSFHFGQEYVRNVTYYQQQLVDTLFMCGVDLVLGSHPHVVVQQRIDTINHRVALYSLGNFISNQQDDYKDYGDIAYFALEKDMKTGVRSVSVVRHEPTYVYKWFTGRKADYRVLPLSVLESCDSTFSFFNLKHPLYGKLQEMRKHLEERTVVLPPKAAPVIVPVDTQPSTIPDTLQ